MGPKLITKAGKEKDAVSFLSTMYLILELLPELQ